jgi:hypothetical protein
MQKKGIANSVLIKSAKKLGKGIFYAQLNANTFKIRDGKYRYIAGFRVDDICIFLTGYIKADIEDLTPEEYDEIENVSSYVLSLTESGIEKAVKKRQLIEVDKKNE